jgi:hypothetical protein
MRIVSCIVFSFCALPGHLPQCGIEARVVHPILDVFFGYRAVSPMIAKGFVAGDHDLARLFFSHRAHRQSGRHWRFGQGNASHGSSIPVFLSNEKGQPFRCCPLSAAQITERRLFFCFL